MEEERDDAQQRIRQLEQERTEAQAKQQKLNDARAGELESMRTRLVGIREENTTLETGLQDLQGQYDDTLGQLEAHRTAIASFMENLTGPSTSAAVEEVGDEAKTSAQLVQELADRARWDSVQAETRNLLSHVKSALPDMPTTAPDDIKIDNPINLVDSVIRYHKKKQQTAFQQQLDASGIEEAKFKDQVENLKDKNMDTKVEGVDAVRSYVKAKKHNYDLLSIPDQTTEERIMKVSPNNIGPNLWCLY